MDSTFQTLTTHPPQAPSLPLLTTINLKSNEYSLYNLTLEASVIVSHIGRENGKDRPEVTAPSLLIFSSESSDQENPLEQSSGSSSDATLLTRI